ncbi:hypothetical protein N9W21_07445, partial [Shewanella sp.]|nr:hypothetical protein [Shewanella sp.]
MSWKQIQGKTTPHSTMQLDAQSCTEYGVRLPANFPFSKVLFTTSSLAMLSQLNDYDLQMVAKEIIKISVAPCSPSSIKHSRNPFKRIWRTTHPFRRYHYLITYSLKANHVIMNDILYDEQLFGSKDQHSAERTMLYEVKRIGPARYDGEKSEKELAAIQAAWSKKATPVPQIRTAHAAVNGMLNDFNKAAWLMGTHLDTAYQSDGIQAYTLYHNPSDKGLLDVVECAFDKRAGTKSHNAAHLASILAQNNQQGKKVKWVVHSQGAIIFCAALEHYRIHYRGRLSGQQVAIH